MRRMLPLLGAFALVVALVSSASATAPSERVNRFIGDFDMLAGDTVIGHIRATFTEATDRKLVPGSLDIDWAPDVADDAFPFMDLAWKPVRESHAQLIGGYFGVEPGYATIAGTSGYLCDYTAPTNGDCRPFAVHFDRPLDGSPEVMWWTVGDAPELQLGVGAGTFVIVYAGPTG